MRVVANLEGYELIPNENRRRLFGHRSQQSKCSGFDKQQEKKVLPRVQGLVEEYTIYVCLDLHGSS